jgi:hypothetical protein
MTGQPGNRKQRLERRKEMGLVFKRDYEVDGMSMEEIAEKHGTNRAYVKRALVDAGTVLRRVGRPSTWK